MLLKKLSIDFEKMNSAVDSLVGVVRGKLSINEEKEFRIRLVSKELLTNILSYSKASDIKMSAALENGMLTLTIEDDGDGFAYQELIKRDVTEESYIMQDGGRGVFLVRMMSDDFHFNESGTMVTVKLRLK